MKPSAGERLGSTACSTEVIVVRPPAADVHLTCGFAPMMPLPAEIKEKVAEDGPGSLAGKRYVHPASGMELLCTKPGAGQLRVDDDVLGIRQAKNLPSSD
jgi:hypothetical protein